MLKNFFIIGFRSIRRNKAHTAINVAGLALGIACCLLLFLVVRYESSFDRHHAKAERIYRVNTQFMTGEGGVSTNAPVPVGKALKEEFPEIEEAATTRFYGSGLIKVGDQVFREPGIANVGPAFFRIFDVNWLAGSPETSLAEPNTVVLSKSVAEKYFGPDAATNPATVLGRTITFNSEAPLQITGLVEDFPATTDLPFRILISYATLPTPVVEDHTYWVNISNSYSHFLLLKEGVDPQLLEAKFPVVQKKYTGENRYAYLLQPLSEMHHDSRFSNYNRRIMPPENINGLILIGLFILFTACINFINLATAQSVKRSKEVGVRKVLGANRNQLLRQFLAETFLITSLAMVVAVVAALFALPYLQELLEVAISFRPLQDATLLAFLAAITLVVTLLAGFYPAMLVSGFRPVAAIKNKITAPKTGALTLRQGLIVMQFVIAQVLIIGTLVVSSQLDYFRNLPLGYNQEALITVPLPANTQEQAIYPLRTQLEQLSGVKNVSFGFTPPSNDGGWFGTYNFEGSGLKDDIVCQMMPIDANYLETYGLTLLAGRNLRQVGDTAAVLVNEALLRTMHIDNPEKAIGRTVSNFGRALTIVGVVKDFHSQSLRQAIGPVLMERRDQMRFAGIKLHMADLRSTLGQIEQQWKQTFPESVFEFTFLEEDIANFYREEVKMYTLFRIFSGIALFISCLGLYGLVSFMAVQRTKEIGIRKVLGASVTNIVLLFTKEFFVLIFIAFSIAAPLAWYFMNAWLQNFEYQVSLGLSVFLAAILFSLLIAGITVGYRSVHAAFSNPVKNLRTE
ncbi:ABC transporter permease [Cesiribacter sp. SM1]|uniref:ABC transporter permease n=1 Tax=Cesiribacter sp. SM1 TaxID=2861196 RepID=UPI001CD61A39|nr:ABC transporter permease [Cesiribacter sp. SM1]